MEIKVKSKENPEGVTCTYNMPSTLAEFTERFGEEQTFNLAVRSATLAVQAVARQHINDQEAAQKAVDAWQPGVRQPGTRKTPFEKAAAALDGMSREELDALLERVRAAKKAEKAHS